MKNRKRNRLKYWNYSNCGWYFVTICTHQKINYFGNIFNGKVVLNRCGNIAHSFWQKIEKLNLRIDLDYFVIMPNHIHGIIVINHVGDANFASPTDRSKMLLCKIIQQYKRAVTMRMNIVQPELGFKWQRSFFDRIIRNDKELYRIRKYICQNPLKWHYEKNLENLEL